VDYGIYELNGIRYVMAVERREAYERELAGATHVGSLRGDQLVGRRYAPLLPYFADRAGNSRDATATGAFRVLPGDFVTTQDGTGVVHIAPGFGEDDQRICAEAGIDLVVPVDSRGRFTAEVADFAGQQVFDANPLIIKKLKDLGVVLRHETYDHSYPHCWRTGTPLIYRAVSSWFVNVTAIKEKMVELNRQITWVPDHIRDGSFGKWLENARDWTISRNRFWGSPIPVWRSDNPEFPRIDVYGSIAELERDFGVSVAELHRPVVDDLVRPNPDDPSGKSMMRRVPEVLDCWFESGSMPFAQVHYPFENREWFESHYPGDFIVEYIGQTRGWFYTLHVLATALFDRPAFKSCISHGIVLGDDGQKMSKSLRNYPDPMKVFDTYGADAMRWYLLSSSILRGADFSVTEAGMRDTVRQNILPLWNSWYFLSLYANAAGTRGRFDTSRVPPRHSKGTISSMLASPCANSWTCSPTGTSVAVAIVSGMGTSRRSTPCTACSPSCAESRPHCCRSPRRRSIAGSPASAAFTSPRGRASMVSMPRTNSWHRWILPATCVRPRCPCARHTSCAYGNHCRRWSSRVPAPWHSATSSRSSRTR
jgi:isoleucyl-tRNA synthetase